MVNAVWSATKTRQYNLESRTRMPFRRGAIRGHSTVAHPIARYSSNQSRPPGIQRAGVGSTDHGEYRPRCINVRHADGHSRVASPCSDTRAGAGQNRSFAMIVTVRSGGRTTSIGTKEPCSAEDHRNRDQHRNDAGSSLVLTKTPCSRHR